MFSIYEINSTISAIYQWINHLIYISDVNFQPEKKLKSKLGNLSQPAIYFRIFEWNSMINWFIAHNFKSDKNFIWVDVFLLLQHASLKNSF